ncbi:MAG: fimbrial biogenesis chaperone [Georgenia sp.]
MRRLSLSDIPRLPVRLAARARLVAGALLLLGSGARSLRAVTVSPSALYIDNRTRSGVITLINTGTRPEEIEIGFAFGYPRADSLGAVTVQLLDTVPGGEPSAVSWLRAFPRRIRLEPGQRQAVRVLVQPPEGLAPGEYWARILVRSRGAQPPIEERQGEIRLQVEVETVIATALSYRNGPVSTGIVEAPVRAVPVTDSLLRLVMDLERQGNAAFLGRLRAELVSPAGVVVAREDEDIAVYRTMRRKFDIVLPPELRGKSLAGFVVRYSLDTERQDLPPGGALPVPPRQGKVSVSERSG